MVVWSFHEFSSLHKIYFLAVSCVLQKAPFLLRNKQIYVEEIRLDGQKVDKEADEEFSGSLCTIEVSGIKDTTSKDSVEFYFDNKKSGGGNVEEVKGEGEDGVLLITFKNEQSKWTGVLFEVRLNILSFCQ